MDISFKLKIVAHSCFGILIGLLVFSAYNTFVNPTVGRIIITGVFPQDTNITIHSVSEHNDSTTFIETITAQASIGQYAQRAGTGYINAAINRLHLKFDALESHSQITNKSEPIVLHSIQLIKPYQNDIYISNSRILDNFIAQKSENVGPKELHIRNAQNANSLLSKDIINKPIYSKSIVLALIFSIGFSLLIYQFSWRNIPAFKDMSLGREISSSHEFAAINGLRGLAAILVLLSHTAPGFYGIGVGLAMLLVLSGFLLSKPFILAPNKIFSIGNIQLFVVKRLKRILPMYYLYIFITYVVALKMDIALKHFLFVQAEGHLWPMPQIFAFYMLLPFILIATSLLFKVNKVLPILFLVSAAYLWQSTALEWKPFYNGQYSREFLLYAFLIGVACAYIQYGLLFNNPKVSAFLNKRVTVFSIIGIIVTFLLIAWSAPIEPPIYLNYYIDNPLIKCMLCAVIILLTLNTQDSWFQKLISNKVFSSVGIVGFSFYILHGLSINIVHSVQTQLLAIHNPPDRSWELTLMAFCITYIMSVMAYSYIERPFFGFRKSINNPK